MAEESKQGIDPDVREVMEDQKRLARGVGRQSAERERKIQRLIRVALHAIRNKDQRAFARHLLEADVREGSPEWERAWKIFWSA